MLYKIKNARRLKVQDLRAIAYFNKVIINYLKMDRILKNSQDEH